MSGRVFIVKAEPFICHSYDSLSVLLIHERELAKETDVFFSVKSTVLGFVEIFSRAQYIKFDSRLDALLHIEEKTGIQIELLEKRLYELRSFQENIITEAKRHEHN
ncbi:TPA: hypothetical protein OKD67_004702 [Escherichia coli]|nr:hypothetical protein [Escherichia coli]HBN1752752.1 hypothetical protein [Escherichia coli]HBN1766372.1 hypothetical protein [Escherichia coli]HBN1775127.1 hypothetical protein [Escherichia coli]HBN1784985.1 hypothetical protein [Escherichia coli]